MVMELLGPRWVKLVSVCVCVCVSVCVCLCLYLSISTCVCTRARAHKRPYRPHCPRDATAALTARLPHRFLSTASQPRGLLHVLRPQVLTPHRPVAGRPGTLVVVSPDRDREGQRDRETERDRQMQRQSWGLSQDSLSNKCTRSFNLHSRQDSS